mmetsp:Transcript_23004/g.47771  ORF Transcript_23004/g.47771 Transcript_23004/m.47771 type:complete len:244 (-) Transcript_23004:271-1002(-)
MLRSRRVSGLRIHCIRRGGLVAELLQASHCLPTKDLFLDKWEVERGGLLAPVHLPLLPPHLRFAPALLLLGICFLTPLCLGELLLSSALTLCTHILLPDHAVLLERCGQGQRDTAHTCPQRHHGRASRNQVFSRVQPFRWGALWGFELDTACVLDAPALLPELCELVGRHVALDAHWQLLLEYLEEDLGPSVRALASAAGAGLPSGRGAARCWRLHALLPKQLHGLSRCLLDLVVRVAEGQLL